MDYTFPNFPQGVVFNNAFAPGDQAFASAWQYWADQAKRTAMGKGGLPQLAAGRAADQPAQQYQASPYAGPSAGGTAQNAGLAAKGANLVGQAGARSTKQKVSNDVTNASLSGGLDAANAYGTSLQNELEGNIALNKAQASQTGGMLGGLTGFLSSLFGGPFGQAGLQSLLGAGGAAGAGAAGAGAAGSTLGVSSIFDMISSGAISPEAFMALAPAAVAA